MDGKVLTTVENSNPLEFTNVDLFVGNEWHNPADVVLRNFTWSSGSNDQLECAADSHCSDLDVCKDGKCVEI